MSKKRSPFELKYKFLLGIIVVSLLPALPFFVTNDLLHTHDGLVHLPRLAAYFQALTDGHFPVRFAGYLNYGYGLPLFNFMYQTPYVIGSSFLLLGFSLVNAFKISLSLSFILSGIFMYLFAKEYFGDEKKGFLVAIFYQFAPFRMVELLVRGSYGEVYTYVFFPLILYGLVLLGKKLIVRGFIITTIATCLLIISHNSVSLLFTGAAVLFLLFVSKNIKDVSRGMAAFVMGIIIASFYWAPAILEHKYTFGNLYMQNLYKEHFVPIQNFFLPNFTNDPSLQTGGVTTFIGLFHILAIIVAVFVMRRKKDSILQRTIIYSLLLLIISFFFILPISSFLWASPHMPLLRQFQFPWRFLALIVIATSLLSVNFLFLSKSLVKNIYYYGLITVVIISVAFYWKASLGYKKINEKYYWNFPLNTTYYGETDVIWSAGPAKEFPKSRIEIIGGNGEILNFTKKNHYQRFTTESDEKMTIVSNTQFYPGWKAFINGEETPVQFQDPNHRGLLVFNIPPGKNEIELKFTETKLRILANTISLFGVILLVPAAFAIKKYMA